MILTNYNTVIYDDGTEVQFNDFIKRFKNNNKDKEWISYDKKYERFIVVTEEGKFELKVPKERQARMKHDPVIRQLLLECSEHDMYLMQKEIAEKVRATGALPVDRSEANIYYDYLKEEHKKTNAAICKKSLSLVAPFVLGPSSALSFIHAINIPQEDFFAFLGYVFLSGMLFIGAVNTGCGFRSNFKDLIENWKKGKIQKIKMASLEDNARRIFTKRCAEQRDLSIRKKAIDEVNEDTEQVENVEEEAEKTLGPRNYHQEILNEIKELVALVDGLSTKKKVKYMPLINKIITDYQEKLIEYLDLPDNGLVVDACDPYDLYKVFIKSITEIKFDVVRDLEREKEVRLYNDQAELLKSHLNNEQQVQRKAA